MTPRPIPRPPLRPKSIPRVKPPGVLFMYQPGQTALKDATFSRSSTATFRLKD